jgi:sigma-54 specific flagellar transcriptional regulator A
MLVGTIAAQLGRTGRGEVRFAEEALRALRGYAWPGNVRELTNLVERMAVLHPGGLVRVHDLPKRYQPENLPALEEVAVAVEALAPPAPLREAPAAHATHAAHAAPAATAETAETGEAAQRLPEDGINLREHIAGIEITLIRDALDRSHGVVAHAAQLLGLRRTTLVEKLRKYGVEREEDLLATES